jgi:hypothetical protein
MDRVQKLPVHRRVKYMLDDRDLAEILRDHWCGSRNNLSDQQIAQFHHDVESSDLLMGEWMSIDWEKNHEGRS